MHKSIESLLKLPGFQDQKVAMRNLMNLTRSTVENDSYIYSWVKRNSSEFKILLYGLALVLDARTASQEGKGLKAQSLYWEGKAQNSSNI